MARMSRTQENRRLLLEQLAHALLERLHQIFPFIQANNATLLEILNEIVLPAAELESLIHMSTHYYEFLYMGGASNPEPFSLAITAHQVEILTCVDSKTKKRLKPGRPFTSDANGYVALVICVIEPSLYRKLSDSDNSHRRLQKDRALVMLFGEGA